jgi:hypothetical protein
MVLVMRAGYSRYNNLMQEQGYGTDPATQLGMLGVNVDPLSSGFPDFTMTNYTGFGDGGYLPTHNINNVYTGSGSLQWTKGAHFFKFGGEFTRRQDADYQSAEGRVAYAFTPAFTGDRKLGSIVPSRISRHFVAQPLFDLSRVPFFREQLFCPGRLPRNALVDSEHRAAMGLF